MRILFFLLLMTTVAHATVANSVLEQLLPGCGNPCTIQVKVDATNGGLTFLFILAAEAIKETNTKLIIDGPCLSSCVMLADLARPNVCVTENAVFLAHMARDIRTREPAPGAIKMSGDIAQFVKDKGGLPLEGWLAIPLRFWKPCKESSKSATPKS